MKGLRTMLLLLSLCLCMSRGYAQEQQPLLEVVRPEVVGIDGRVFAYADSLVEKAIADGEIPGGVLAVMRQNKLAYLKAYGHRSLVPEVQPMTTETVFDMASLTKPLATGIATMMLLERGQILLQDRVSKYLPEWSSDDPITIRHLLTHTSGLPSYASVRQVSGMREGKTLPEKLALHIATCKREVAPGEKMIYSCLNFITLQHVIERITGQSLKDFTDSQIYRPMWLRHTGFLPSARERLLCAPTEIQPDGRPLLGEVHDPLARLLNLGVSGNAGLFSTAEEVSALCAMLLNGGTFKGRRILSSEAVRAFTTIPAGYEEFGRTLGWSSSPAYSNLGNLTSRATYGHTGYTGTSVSIDPEEGVAVVFLSNRVHPRDTTSTTRLFATLRNVISAGVRPKTSSLAYVSAHYVDRMEAFKKDPIDSSSIVMLGNSITEGGRDWNALLPGLKHRVVNRGISADVTAGVLHRLSEIVAGKPYKLFLLIGVNDISMDVPIETIAERIGEILDRLHFETPDTKLYLQTVMPIDESYRLYIGLNGKTRLVPRLNIMLKEVARKRPYVTLVDLYPHFLSADKRKLNEGITTDGLHLNAEGYKIWSKVLRPYMD